MRIYKQKLGSPVHQSAINSKSVFGVLQKRKPFLYSASFSPASVHTFPRVPPWNLSGLFAFLYFILYSFMDI